MPLRSLENRVFLALVLATTAFFLWMVRGFLMPVFWAAVFATLFQPLFLLLKHHFAGRRTLAALAAGSPNGRWARWRVGASNQNPTASPGGPYTGTEGSAVSFNGSGSSDPDGDALGYEWSFGDGSTSMEENPSHTYVQDGTYTVALTVRDGKGGEDTKTNHGHPR